MNKKDIKLLKERINMYQDWAIDESKLREKEGEKLTVNEHSINKWEAESSAMALRNYLNDADHENDGVEAQ